MLGLGTLSRVIGEVRRDVAAAHARDPAARGVSSAEILSSWPGVQAVLAHRVAHGLHTVGVPLAPRTLSLLSRAWTGVEIHPAACIGKGFFIDHAAGVVIGETAEIGDDVTLYQGVTLGGTGFQTGKRPEGPDCDWIHLPDPIADAINRLSSRIAELEREVGELSGSAPQAGADVRPLRPVHGPSPAGG